MTATTASTLTDQSQGLKRLEAKNKQKHWYCLSDTKNWPKYTGLSLAAETQPDLNTTQVLSVPNLAKCVSSQLKMALIHTSESRLNLGTILGQSKSEQCYLILTLYITLYYQESSEQKTNE